ncbi:MAG: thiamine diphosphokinase [Candidatus Mcinerneyibacterium aminivorans]|uniref:Thiamine diphosphokinase n=1 Tax=Candidatus Mcinerneyibacterium aminivorans TaxID=2703815 RepID=A0A5D0MF14_9BACT|nr:MAG: thiamine diphosphokinase [Candidatus Mcinerneyibacterium aminivorans]
MNDIIYLISGSPEIDFEYLKSLNLNKKKVYAIDSGYKICNRLKIIPKKIIGDFDSSSYKKVVSMYDEEKVFKYPKKKNKSDTELGIDMALSNGYKKIIVLNATGGRIDHEFFNIFLLLKSPGKIVVQNKLAEMYAIKKQIINKIKLKKGQYFSLLPLSEIKNLSIKNAEYELENKDIQLNSLTLSNRALSNNLEIHFDEGKLLIYILKGKK